ncbi:glycosyltransferase [Paracoccaceae bacterium]|jgi:glycosyltransferase involved in cell wall biosynthesis|nr:glycosyltransferase [Paracoccaceae bacterium]
MRISVVITTFNHERFIKRCIQSIMQQTIFKECELIICDDCSTDATLEQIYGSIGKNKNVIVKRHEKNVGMRQNFAEGINTASCDFIAYLDGDDYLIKNNKLEKDLNFLIEREDRNFVFSPALIEKDGILTNKIRDNYTRWKEEVSIKWLSRKGGGFYPTSSVFFRRRIIDSLPANYWLLNEQYDLPLAIAALIYGKKIHYRSDVATVYRIHRASVSNKKKTKYQEAKRLLVRCKKNISYVEMLRQNKFVDEALSKYLMNWEKFNCFSRLLDVGFWFSSVKRGLFKVNGSFRILLLLKYLIRSPLGILCIFILFLFIGWQVTNR